MNEQVLTVKTGMGAMPYQGGVAFRVWAPHAERVFVMGTFNNWAESHPMQPDSNGAWYVEVPQAKIGDEYRYLLCQGEQKLSRIDHLQRLGVNVIEVMPAAEFAGDVSLGL